MYNIKETRPFLLLRKIWRRLHVKSISTSRLLCGGEYGLSGTQFAYHSNDLRRTSTTIAKSPHLKFLQEYQSRGESILLPDNFKRTAYYTNAMLCIKLFGRYFSATNEEHLYVIARNFIADYEGKQKARARLADSATFSSGTDYPQVSKIPYSDCYQVQDGNHRLAIAMARGATACRVRVLKGEQCTSLQQLLLAVSWNANRRDLYQPLISPELGASWRVVRRCSDRLQLMSQFLETHFAQSNDRRTYLDVACNYGWFLKSMRDMGYEAFGVEIDRAARNIGEVFYDIPSDHFYASEAVDFLRNCEANFDVVSCFSLAHHFAMRSDQADVSELARMLDRVTGQILFFEMGDEGEEWFRDSLSGWNPEYIANWLKSVTSFNSIVALGQDQDRIFPFESNYRRTLFACTR